VAFDDDIRHTVRCQKHGAGKKALPKPSRMLMSFLYMLAGSCRRLYFIYSSIERQFSWQAKMVMVGCLLTWTELPRTCCYCRHQKKDLILVDNQIGNRCEIVSSIFIISHNRPNANSEPGAL
jgi:hypothetical protein